MESNEDKAKGQKHAARASWKHDSYIKPKKKEKQKKNIVQKWFGVRNVYVEPGARSTMEKRDRYRRHFVPSDFIQVENGSPVASPSENSIN